MPGEQQDAAGGERQLGGHVGDAYGEGMEPQEWHRDHRRQRRIQELGIGVQRLARNQASAGVEHQVEVDGPPAGPRTLSTTHDVNSPIPNMTTKATAAEPGEPQPRSLFSRIAAATPLPMAVTVHCHS